MAKRLRLAVGRGDNSDWSIQSTYQKNQVALISTIDIIITDRRKREEREKDELLVGKPFRARNRRKCQHFR